MDLHWQTWLSLRLPSQCWVCHAWPCAGVLCSDCLHYTSSHVARCTGCALALPGLGAAQARCGRCLRRPPLWGTATAWVDYHYPWSSLIARWKFGQQAAMAGHFARWMQQSPSVQLAVETADVLIPIPLSHPRMRERGYNPAAQIARCLAPRRCLLHTLQRVQHSVAQSDLPRAQRLRNLRHAFAVPAAQAPALQGRRVLLVDDVMTTGATLTAASRCLRQAGATHIDVLCVARTP